MKNCFKNSRLKIWTLNNNESCDWYILIFDIKHYSFLTFFTFYSIKALKPGSWTYRLGEFADEINKYVPKVLKFITVALSLSHTDSQSLFLSIVLKHSVSISLPLTHHPFIFFFDVQLSQNFLRPEIDGHSDGRTVRTIRVLLGSQSCRPGRRYINWKHIHLFYLQLSNLFSWFVILIHEECSLIFDLLKINHVLFFRLYFNICHWNWYDFWEILM